MPNIGIFGAENSHAYYFSRFFNEEKAAPGWRVTAVGGEDNEAAEKIVREFGVPQHVQNVGEMLGHVDAAMITSRDGALHLRYARPFLEAGLPVFVDKPFARSEAEAETLTALAEKSGALLMGGSSVKLVDAIVPLRDAAKQGCMGGNVYAPVDMVNPYGDFWFYSAHLAETVIAVFGPEIRSVRAEKSAGGVLAVLQYPAFSVTCHFLQGVYDYGADVYTKSGVVHSAIDIGDCYRRECELFIQMIRTGVQPQSFADLRLPVRVLAAIQRSFETGLTQIL